MFLPAGDTLPKSVSPPPMQKALIKYWAEGTQHWPKLSTAGRFNATVVNVALETHILGHVHAFRQRATSEGFGPSGALQPLGLACTWPLVRRHSNRSPRAMGAGSQQGAQAP